MRKLKLVVFSLVFLAACTGKALPPDVIEQRNMISVLVDLHVVDGYMSSLMQTDSIRIHAKNYYATVYRNHNITKAVFDKSMEYYSTQPTLIDSMYSRVDYILKKKEEKLTKIQEAKQKKLPQPK